jgi:hypothetical protein
LSGSVSNSLPLSHLPFSRRSLTNSPLSTEQWREQEKKKNNQNSDWNSVKKRDCLLLSNFCVTILLLQLHPYHS